MFVSLTNRKQTHNTTDKPSLTNMVADILENDF